MKKRKTMYTAAYPPPPAPVGTTPTLYLTPQLEKRPDGLAPSLLDLSTAIKTGSTHDSSSSLACKSYRTSSQYLKATPKDDSRELQTIVDSIMSTLEAMTDAKSGTKDLVSMTFEPQGCVWSLEFNPRLRAQNYQLQVICKGCADSEGNNAYVVDTVLVPKRKPSQQDSGLKEATEAFEFAQLQVRKAIVKLEFPDFPEGCKGRPFREVYQLNARLKSGSFATVCRGTHRATGKKVAIKCVLRKDLPPSDDAAIYDEVAILSALDHPHITPLIDFFDEKDCYFLVMELMSGGDLFDRIGKKKNYSEADARELCIKMLKAMAYCHELNIAHNDMKPKNLLLVSEEHDAYIKIADFGFAARVYEPKSLTKQCGTPFFVSPEILQRQPYDQKSDMWSIGVIIYLLLAGNLPFMGRSQKELFRKIVIGKYQFVDDSWSDVTNDARNLVEKLLVTDPDKRLSAKECLEHPWLKQDFGRLSLIKLQSTSQRLKTFNARMKLRSAMIAVDWVSSLQRQSWKDIPDTDEPSRRTSVTIPEGDEDDSD